MADTTKSSAEELETRQAPPKTDGEVGTTENHPPIAPEGKKKRAPKTGPSPMENHPPVAPEKP